MRFEQNETVVGIGDDPEFLVGVLRWSIYYQNEISDESYASIWSRKLMIGIDSLEETFDLMAEPPEARVVRGLGVVSIGLKPEEIGEAIDMFDKENVLSFEDNNRLQALRDSLSLSR